MAESQEAYLYTPEALDEIRATLSIARLAPYNLEAHGDPVLAMKLYLWNSRLAKALLFPLHLAEVATRNSIHRTLSQLHGPDWILRPPFMFTEQTQDAYDRSRRRLTARKPAFNNNDLIAALNFDFWSNLFRPEYQYFWDDGVVLGRVFRQLPETYGYHSVQRTLKSVNDLRNRVAHHEPVHLDTKLNETYDEILELIGWISPGAERWTRRHSTFPSTMTAKPNSASTLPGRVLALANLRKPAVLAAGDKLQDLLDALRTARPAIVLLDTRPSETAPYAVVSSRSVLEAITKLCHEGIIDLGDWAASDVTAHAAPIPYRTISKDSTTGDALALFFPVGVKAIDRPPVPIVVDAQGGPVGALMHPDIRY